MKRPDTASIGAWARDSPRLKLVRMYPMVGRLLTVSLIVLVVLSPFLSLVVTVASGRLVGAVAPAVEHGFESAEGGQLLFVLAVLGAGFILDNATGGAREVLAQVAGRRFDRRIRARLLDATLLPPGVAHLEDPEVLDKLATARGDTTGITPGMAATGIVNLVVSRLAVLPHVFLLITFRWWLPLVIGASMIWMRVVMRKHIMDTVNAKINQSASLRQSTYFVDLALLPAAAKETRVFGLGRWLTERYERHYLDAMRVVWKHRIEGRHRLFTPVIATAATSALGMMVVAQAGVRGVIDPARVTILFLAVNGMRALLSLNNEDVQVEQGVLIIPVVEEVEARMAERRESIAGHAPATGLPGRSVLFEGVCFRYPGSDNDVYRSLDLEIRAGESLAIVGVNGSGKTTLVKLLARLHDPTEGRITVDGADLRTIDPDQWQRRVAAIFQDFTRYELSAADNVGFGALELAGDSDALADAVEKAGATEIVEGLEKGWDTILSRRFTDGTDLSGGQWQRIALGRALLAVRGGAGILVLDEPTANLDVRAEAQLYERFLELTRGVTTIVISHRFSTVRKADRIVVLDEGRVVEDGTHDELVAFGGHYERMFSLQAARFLEDLDPEVDVLELVEGDELLAPAGTDD